MQVAGTIQAQANQKSVFFEKGAPFIVQQSPIGLQGVFESHAGSPVLILELDRFSEEIQPHQGRLSALPGHRHLGAAVAFDQLLDISLQHFFAHAEIAVRVQQLFIQEEAVRTGQVAGGAAGFSQDVDARWDGVVHDYLSRVFELKPALSRSF